MNTNKKTARIAGVLYLLVAICAFFAVFVRSKLIVSGDAAITASNIMASELLFRFGFVSDLIMTTCWILLAFALYVLFKPVNKNHALLMVSFVLVGSAITCINMLNQFAALLVLNGANYLTVLGTDQLQAQAMLFLKLHEHGIIIAEIFFGLWLFPLGYLVFKSGYFPKVLGRILSILLIIAGLGYMIDFLIFFLFPNFDVAITQFTFWGEVLLLLWLLIKGVKIPDMKS
ncbi:hypothetical protein ES705_16494 [subsurface metagenome]|nr:DUF4386 family protein [Methanosarcinales archaeon]